MQTEAVFENIAERILQEISKAEKAIFIAVAWFTNKNIFDLLIEKRDEGCQVFLIISNDKINRNSQIAYERLNANKSKVYKVGDGDTELMHNKFCVIDYNTVITGSYNWSYKAENNFENVIITYDDTALAEQFISEFNAIRNKYYPNEAKIEFEFPLDKIIKRLEILKNYILLEDIEELKKGTLKLIDYDFNSDINEIIKDIKNNDYSLAINKIQNFISKNQALSIWTDPEIAALKLEIKNLENQLNSFDNEKIELEKLLSDFHHRYTIELGEIILEILKLRKIKYKSDKEKYEEAENDEKQYQEDVNEEKNKKVFELTEEERIDLKKKFRKASFLCHPDKVSDEFKEAAQKVFIDLKNAYDANDYTKVEEILNDLEKDNFFKSRSETISEKELLKAAILKLRNQITELENSIIAIKENDTFKLIKDIGDWNEYFNNTKESLQKELEELVKEVGED